MENLKLNKNARIAGAFYLGIIVTSILSFAFIDSQYIVNGEPLKTVINIEQSNLFLRISTGYNFIMYIAVIILSTFLFSLFAEKERKTALLAHTLRSAEAVIGGVSVLCYLMLLFLLKDRNLADLMGEDQIRGIAQLLLASYDRCVMILFGFLGLGSMLYFYLFYRTRLIPRGIAVWGMISFALTLIGSVISIFFVNNAYMMLGSQAIVFELFIGFWLLIKGIKQN